jgi:hypothetical protein
VFNRPIALLILLFLSAPFSAAQTVRIGVLGLFHPKELTLSASRTEAVQISIADQFFVLAPNSPRETAHIKFENKTLLVE